MGVVRSRVEVASRSSCSKLEIRVQRDECQGPVRASCRSLMDESCNRGLIERTSLSCVLWLGGSVMDMWVNERCRARFALVARVD